MIKQDVTPHGLFNPGRKRIVGDGMESAFQLLLPEITALRFLLAASRDCLHPLKEITPRP
jgi:hypothetical protein